LAVTATLVTTVVPLGPEATDLVAGHGPRLGDQPTAHVRVADLGLTGVPTISFVVTLAASVRPTCLESWARSEGISTHWDVGESLAILSGAPSSVDHAFGVSIRNFRTSSGQLAFATNHEAAVPSGVCGEVTGVGVIHSPVRPELYFVPAGGLTPPELLTAYDAGPLRAEGYSGRGQTVVLFESDAYGTRDVKSFAKSLGAPLNLQRYGGMASQNHGESTLDIETVDEIAPRARIVYLNLTANAFNASSEAASFIEAFDAAERNWPGAIWSLSLGWCESDTSVWNATDLRAMNAAVTSAESAGTTVFAASGDVGGLDCTPPNDADKPPRSS